MGTRGMMLAALASLAIALRAGHPARSAGAARGEDAKLDDATRRKLIRDAHGIGGVRQELAVGRLLGELKPGMSVEQVEVLIGRPKMGRLDGADLCRPGFLAATYYYRRPGDERTQFMTVWYRREGPGHVFAEARPPYARPVEAKLRVLAKVLYERRIGPRVPKAGTEIDLARPDHVARFKTLDGAEHVLRVWRRSRKNARDRGLGALDDDAGVFRLSPNLYEPARRWLAGMRTADIPPVGAIPPVWRASEIAAYLPLRKGARRTYEFRTSQRQPPQARQQWEMTCIDVAAEAGRRVAVFRVTGAGEEQRVLAVIEALPSIWYVFLRSAGQAQKPEALRKRALGFAAELAGTRRGEKLAALGSVFGMVRADRIVDNPHGKPLTREIATLSAVGFGPGPFPAAAPLEGQPGRMRRHGRAWFRRGIGLEKIRTWDWTRHGHPVSLMLKTLPSGATQPARMSRAAPAR